MRRVLVVALALAGAFSSGCIVRERVYAPPGPACAGGPAFWVRGHYDRWGRWHPPHWRCPGVVEVY